MSNSFRDIKFPETYQYASDSEDIPLIFYEEAFPIAKRVDLLLGYFSSNAIRVLANTFAEFIYKGGNLRIITNHVFSLKDKENLLDHVIISNEDRVIDLFSDLDQLVKSLSDYGQHFFDCLRYLKQEGRLSIVPVKFNEVDLAHSKKMILYDGKDTITTDGSINFTLAALTKNQESFQVNVPWEGDIFKKRIEKDVENFEQIFSGKHSLYKYLDSSEVEVAIDKIGQPKEIAELLEDSIELSDTDYGKKVKQLLEQKKQRFDYLISDLKGLPRFPFPNGPRDYQKEAYNEWVNNNHSGIFAMATGTGKTITSLNCALNEYRKTKSYRILILVPSIALLKQWEKEVAQFHFNKTLLVGGGNNWKKEFSNYVSDFEWGEKKDLVILSTYDSFILDQFQKLFKKVAKDFLLVADEAHNMGSSNRITVFNKLDVEKKIGLSATPKRVYDPKGTDSIKNFFNDQEPFTYTYSMKDALGKFLTEYKYYPVVVELDEEEILEYQALTKRLLRFFDFKTGKFKDHPQVQKLLLFRKSIIHKAINKIGAFTNIIAELKKENLAQYVFAYVPEGYARGEGKSERIIDTYIKKTAERFPDLRMNSYTAADEDLDDLLRGFSEGKIEVLFAMKMLDEGVDVPRAEVGIFASSTGNPRQFIQRRGRLLRKHPDKTIATVYDMVVVPPQAPYDTKEFKLERNLIKNELRRVGYFASLAINYYDSKDKLDNLCKKYNLDLDTIISELE